MKACFITFSSANFFENGWNYFFIQKRDPGQTYLRIKSNIKLLYNRSPEIQIEKRIIPFMELYYFHGSFQKWLIVQKVLCFRLRNAQAVYTWRGHLKSVQTFFRVAFCFTESENKSRKKLWIV